MGLDISFSLEKALEAGLETKVDLCDYRDMGEPEQTVELLLKVPNSGYWVGMFTCAQQDGEVAVSVRANKWGETYGPLTSWLQSNNIAWEEY